ncbi:protein MIZU-KUSSEI 1-like [Quillaja saponaria]|uniref:Protein MIZU-KUSSEI 1-like n=1 Tax=Quillaja saponaria TaxID=32244 RepID=A0AAD7KT87_QUISA|nr:protein MIZU-KUSSEI 1-like [Quillaja saponaria]
MGEPISSSTSRISSIDYHHDPLPTISPTSSSTSGVPSPPAPPPPRTQPTSLVQPTQKRKPRTKVFRVFRSVFRSFPIITPACKFPTIPMGNPEGHRTTSGARITGTLFGYRKGRVSISLQENPRCLPSLVVELAMQTNALQKEMSAGMVRIALECEKRPEKDKTRLFDEPIWSMFCNGKKTGYGVRREATEEDLHLMEILKAVSMGAGVLPGQSDVDGPDGELAYIRAHFERVVGSKDSETLYMLSPEGNTGPELSIFFVRI